jgi:hypothetical protein
MASIKKAGISVVLPAGWRESPHPEGLLALGPVEGSLRPSLLISSAPAEAKSAEEEAARQLADLRSLPAYKVVSEGAEKLGKVEGILRQQEFKEQNIVFVQFQLYVVRGKTAYTLTYSAPKTRGERAKTESKKLFGAVVLPAG